MLRSVAKVAGGAESGGLPSHGEMMNGNRNYKTMKAKWKGTT